MKAQREVIVTYHEHVDAQWARCNDRPHKYHDFIIRSYMEVFEWVILEAMELSKRGLTFAEGEIYFWRYFLEKHPEKRDELKQRIREKKFEIVRQGELVIDTNYTPAEGLVRNQLLTKGFYEEYCGEGYWPGKLAFPWDSFGNSANMPQVYKLSGVDAVGGEKYRICPDHFWVGIDGTKIPCIDQLYSNVNRLNDPVLYVCGRHPHCPECGGKGCPGCNGRGFIEITPIQKESVKETLLKAAEYGEKKKFVLIGGEEALPNADIVDAVEELNTDYKGDVHFRFGTIEEFWEEHKAFYQSVEEDYKEASQDLNPVNSGCYTTRIRLKQRCREVAYALIRAEAEIALGCWNQGKVCKNPENMRLAWENMMLNFHHDSIGGTHIDGGYDELMDFLDESESIAMEFARPVKKVTAKRIGKGCIQKGKNVKKLGDLTVIYDQTGILQVLKSDVDVFGEFRLEKLAYNSAVSRPVRIGELVLMDDWGSAYSWYRLSEPMLLGDYNYAVVETKDGLWWRGRRDVGDPGARRLEWDVCVRASQDGQRLDFTTEVNWDTENKRLKVLVPVNDHLSMESVWEIPFGFLKHSYDPNAIHEEFAASQINRCISEKGNMQRIAQLSDCGEHDFRPTACAEYDLHGLKITGEYPALHWVRHDIEASQGVAVLNKGLPSARWVPGCFEISLLRSPQMHCTLTVLPHVEEVWDIDGVRDTGKHRFEYSVFPMTNSVSNGDLTRLGYTYNGASPTVPFKYSGDVAATAFKVSEDGRGFIFRVQEANGSNTTLEINFDEERTVIPVNLMEDPVADAVVGKIYKYEMHKHEIFTLFICP